jgi:hypothetical protein
MSDFWIDTEIGGKKCASAEYAGKRLYVSQSFVGFYAWVDQYKVGLFHTLNSAKNAAIASASGVAVVAPKPVTRPLPKSSPFKFVGDPAAGIVVAMPAPKSTSPTNINGGLAQSSVFQHPAPHSDMMVETAPPAEGLCKCGTRLGRSGKCPALCESVPDDPPIYTGPERVGRTHLARLAAPVA